MMTERQNIACSMIFKALSNAGSLQSCFVCMDVDSSEGLAMQILQIPNKAETRIVPTGFFHLAFQTKIGLPSAVQLSRCCCSISAKAKKQ
jgi:hypothetical protein